METHSALLAFCAGNSPVPGEFPAQRPVTRSFDVFFDLRLNKRLMKQSWGWWFETPSHSLWRHRNVQLEHGWVITSHIKPWNDMPFIQWYRFNHFHGMGIRLCFIPNKKSYGKSRYKQARYRDNNVIMTLITCQNWPRIAPMLIILVQFWHVVTFFLMSTSQPLADATRGDHAPSGGHYQYLGIGDGVDGRHGRHVHDLRL